PRSLARLRASRRETCIWLMPRRPAISDWVRPSKKRRWRMTCSRLGSSEMRGERSTRCSMSVRRGSSSPSCADRVWESSSAPPPGDAHGPALVAEMALQLADDRWRGVGGELESPLRVEAVDGFQEPDRRHLDEVVEGLAPVGEAPGEVLGQPEMGGDELVPQAGVSRAVVLVEL